MEIMNIISQFIGAIALVCWIWSIQFKDKSRMLKIQIVANIFYSGQYFIICAFSAGCMNLVSVVRSIIYYENDKKAKKNSIYMLLSFVIIIIIIGIITFKSNWLNIIPIIISLAYTYATWQKDTKTMRWVFMLGAVIWIYYNIKIGAYISLIGNMFEIVSGIIAITRFDLKTKNNWNN